MTPTPRLASFTMVGTLSYLGLAVLGWGGFGVPMADRGVGFDEAFRNAMAGAAQVLSGHGKPG
jgi:hypothetical protein